MLVELKLEQGSAEWLKARRALRMASETPAIMGLSSYQSPNDVRAAKAGKGVFVNQAMRQGNDQEPIAREAYGRDHEPMRPAVFKRGDYGCSLDGLNMAADKLLEIKVPFKDAPSSERWLAAEAQGVTPADYAQTQHQLMVMQAPELDFLVWDAATKKYILAKVLPDPDFWKKIEAAWDEFWPSIAIREDKEWIAAAAEYRIAKAGADLADAKLEAAKKHLFSLNDLPFAQGAGLSVSKVSRVGAVDWAKVTAKHLVGVDVDLFRKKGTSFYEVKVAK